MTNNYFDEIVNNWNAKWFGFWGEADDDPIFLSPSKITQKGWLKQKKNKIVYYLANSPCLFVGQIPHEKCLICPEMIHVASVSTDNEWLWPHNLAHYVAAHDVLLPPKFVEHIESQKFTPPNQIFKNWDELSWPPE